MRSRHLLAFSLITVIIILGVMSPIFGQGDTIITVAAPSYMAGSLQNDTLFDAFETAHPGVKVVMVSMGNDIYYAPAANDLDKHLEGAAKYATAADVTYVSDGIVSVESTRAGDFLDLAPLISSDSNFDSSDFFPKIWQDAQWDGGTWFLPVSASPQILVYDKKAFDKANLPYPSPSWTFDDFANAARALTTHTPSGAVDVPGAQVYNPALFFYALNKQLFYDDSVSPSAPKFDSPDLPPFLEQWKALQKELSVQGNYDYNAIPLTLNQPWQLTNPPSEDHDWAGSLLPGGIAGLDVQGFAVSSGTLNPELAYALADYLTKNPDILTAFYGNTPARKSMVGVKPENNQYIPPPISADVQSLLDQAIENAVPASELRFFSYIDVAINKDDSDTNFDAKAAIQEAEVNAVKSLDASAAHKGTSSVYVSTAVPTPSFNSDQILLHFGVSVDTSSNQDTWKQFISDYLAANPAVGNVELATQFYQQSDLDKLDCYYQPYNMVPSMKQSDFLNFDPFIDADPDFVKSDFIGTTLDQVTRDNHIWGYPIVIQPSVLWYDKDQFDKAGLPSPEQGWTVDAFKDALQTLKSTLAKETDPVFMPSTFGNTYLLMLMAAYGGVPYDYRTTPPTINFTDPTTVDAIRQVLDLAKDGYIGYQKLVTNGGVYGGGTGAPISDDSLSSYSWRLQNRNNPDFKDPSRLANFPKGSSLIPVAYGIGTGYITSHAQNPDACYKFIAQLAKRPDLLGGMPARVSQASDPTISAAQGEDVTALYQSFVETFQQPNTVTFPGQFGSDGSNFNSYVEPLWLNKAFDDYVLADGDLDKDLADAETYAKAYRDCASVIPEVDPSQLTTPEESKAYYKQYVDCAVKIDSTLKDYFSYYYEDNTGSS